MQNTDFENAADAAFVAKYFLKFINEHVHSQTYLPEVTEPILKALGVTNKKSLMAAMVYAFTAGMNTGIGLAMAADESKE